MIKLLEGVDVNWKSFGEVAKIQRGASPRPISKYISDEDGVPWIKIGDTSPDSKYVNGTAQKITFEGAKKSRTLNKGNFIISNSMSFGRPYILNIDGAIHDGWASISDFDKKLNSDYLYHYLSSDIVQNYWKSKINSGSVSNLNADIIKSLQIPVISLDVQTKIAKILDAFIVLKIKLIEELKAREDQYNHYREYLFSFKDSSIEWRKLGEVGQFVRGRRFVKTDITSEGFPSIHYGEMYTHYNIEAKETKSFISETLASKLRVANHGDVIIVAAGETVEDIGIGTAWLGNTDVVIHDACFSYKSKLNPKYVSYFLRTRLYHEQIKKYISSGKISAINSNGLSHAKIPIPTPAEQDRIVAILDNFDELTNSIKGKLPMEIKLRQKQYEYYRELLLNLLKQK
jgi:type I restriction enzyme S subunit